MTTYIMEDVRDIVDDMATIQKDLDDIGATDLLKRQEALKKQLAQIASEFEPDEPITFTGDYGKVTFSKAPVNRTVVKLRELSAALGDDAFYQVAKVSVSALKNWLPDREIGQYCEESYGSRRMTKVEY